MADKKNLHPISDFDSLPMDQKQWAWVVGVINRFGKTSGMKLWQIRAVLHWHEGAHGEFVEDTLDELIEHGLVIKAYNRYYLG